MIFRPVLRMLMLLCNYADDTSLDKEIRTSQELREELVPAFAKVCEWLKSNKLSLNTVKTEFMIIGTPCRLN